MATKQSKTNSNGNKAEVAKLLKALAAAPKGSSEKRHIRQALRDLGYRLSDHRPAKKAVKVAAKAAKANKKTESED